jgi:uncharacterized membrane protein YfcA
VLADASWVTLISIATIALAAGFVHSAIGFGFGIVAIAVVPWVMDIKSAHIVVSLASVPMIMMASWAYRRGIHWPSLRVALLGAVLFLPLGVLSFEYAPLDWLVRGTGLAILAMVLMGLRKQSAASSPRANMRACFAAGAVSGFLAGAVSVAGPPVAAFALRQQWPQERFKAFVTQCLLVIAVCKSVILVARDLVTAQSAGYVLVAAPLAIVGVQLGLVASRRIPATRFKRIVAIALILVACQMLWRGAPGVDAGNQQDSAVQDTEVIEQP